MNEHPEAAHAASELDDADAPRAKAFLLLLAGFAKDRLSDMGPIVWLAFGVVGLLCAMLMVHVWARLA